MGMLIGNECTGPAARRLTVIADHDMRPPRA